MLNSSLCVFAVEEMYGIVRPAMAAGAEQRFACIALVASPGLAKPSGCTWAACSMARREKEAFGRRLRS